MTTAIAAHDPVEKAAADEHNDILLAAAKLNAMACPRDPILVDEPRWRLTEEEIVRASITVILVALVAVIGIAAGAILTMG